MIENYEDIENTKHMLSLERLVLKIDVLDIPGALVASPALLGALPSDGLSGVIEKFSKRVVSSLEARWVAKMCLLTGWPSGISLVHDL